MSVAFMSELNAESCFQNIMHLRDSGCVRTLRPLFVYATGQSPWSGSQGAKPPQAESFFVLGYPKGGAIFHLTSKLNS